MTELILLIAAVLIILLLINSSRNSRKLAKANRASGAEFLAQNAKRAEVKTTATGLQFEQLAKGDGEIHPGARQKVTVHYHGTLVDGRVFDSSVERGQPATFPLNGVIPGWTEGLQLMVEGEKRRFFIPADLAYGDGSAGIITPGSVLIFDIELLRIEP